MAGVPHGWTWRGVARLAFAGAVVWLLLAGAVIGVNPRSEFPHAAFVPLLPNDVRTKLDAYHAFGDAELVVLGSSISTTMHPDDLRRIFNRSAFNFALPNGIVKDTEAIAGYVLARPQGARMLIVGLEEDQLQASRRSLDATRLAPELRPFVDDPITGLEALGGFPRRFDLGYLHDAGRAVWLNAAGFPSPDRETGPDGFIEWRGLEAERARVPPAFEERIAQQARGRLRFYEQLEEADPASLTALARVVEMALSLNATIHLVFNPLHPALLETVRLSTAFDEVHGRTLAALQALCRPGVHLWDFVSIESFGGRPDDFLDATHATRENTARLAAKLTSPEGDLCA